MSEFTMKNYDKILVLIQRSKTTINSPGEDEKLAKKINELFPLTFVETKTSTTWFTFDTRPKINEIVDIRYSDGSIAWKREVTEERLVHYTNKGEGWKYSIIPSKRKWNIF